MNVHSITPKIFLASALLTTGLLATVPLFDEQIIQTQKFSTTQEQISQIDTQLCNKKFQCSKSGLVIQFLPNNKALFIHPDTTQALKADYTVHFNRHISINVYENTYKNFDLMMKDVIIHSEGFVASVNQKDRYFHAV